MKDWERYDVARHVDGGCVPPGQAGTIQEELDVLAGTEDLSGAEWWITPRWTRMWAPSRCAASSRPASLCSPCTEAAQRLLL